jgi:hypothetical protein
MNLGLKAKVRFNELSDLAVLFRELLLLARWRSLSERNTYSSGRCLSGADRFSLSRTDVGLILTRLIFQSNPTSTQLYHRWLCLIIPAQRIYRPLSDDCPSSNGLQTA